MAISNDTIYTYVQDTLFETIVDATYSTGFPGVSGLGNGTTGQIDDWEGGNGYGNSISWPAFILMMSVFISRRNRRRLKYP